MGKVMYCQKCGRVYHIAFSKKCDWCKTKMIILPEEIKYKYHIFVEDWSKISDEEVIVRKENFVMGELNGTTLFSISEYKRQLQDEIKTNKKLDEFHEHQELEQYRRNLARIQKSSDKQNCIPKCPTCGSTNISNIGTLERSISVGVMGLASSKIGKTMECRNCGAKW